LRRRGSLLARALRIGRRSVPEWLAQLRAEGSVAFGALSLGGVDFERVKAHATCDGVQIALAGLEGRLGQSRIDGGASINLQGPVPGYRVHARWRDLEWQSGSLEAQGILVSRGTGMELVGNLRSSGVFHGKSVALPEAGDEASVRGAYELNWAPAGPRIRFAGLRLTLGGDHYSGQGRSTADGKLIIELASGARELRMSGTLARLAPDVTTEP
jgi:hypothetical protein